jgi:hypothetical protein
VPSFRVTFRLVVEAETEDDAIAEATKAAESGGISEQEDGPDVTVERIPDPQAPSGFVAEGVRRERPDTRR